MATTRFGYLDDLSLKNQKVGIGTSTANERLEVLGETRGGGAVVTGIATITTYSGFDNTKFTTTGDVLITGGESGTLSGEVVIGAGTTLIVGTGATTGQGSIDSLKVSNTFNPPIGGTNDRPTAPKPGALFYNKDFRTIEYWDGNFWKQVDNTTRSGRGLIGGGGEPGTSPYNYAGNFIDSITIPTLGNSVNFGTLSLDTRHCQGLGNETRGLFYLGYHEPGTHGNAIDYVTIASSGAAMDFGDRGSKGYSCGSAASSTRGLFIGGQDPSGAINTINYVNIMTKGDAIDFGDLTAAKSSIQSTINSPTRALIGGGSTPTYLSEIEKINISSGGNAAHFGELICKGLGCGGASNSVRGFWTGAYLSPANTTIPDMQRVIIASDGNAVYFGDLMRKGYVHSGLASQTRGIITSGSPPIDDLLQKIEIASDGNAVYFGDLSYPAYEHGCCSDSHGGLGGY